MSEKSDRADTAIEAPKPVEVTVSQETALQRATGVLRRNFGGLLVGTAIAAPASLAGGALVGALAIDHTYSQALQTAAPLAAEQAIAYDKTQDMEIIQSEVVDPFMKDLSGLGLELASVKAFLVQRQVERGQLDGDITVFLDTIDTFFATDRLTAKYDVAKELYASGSQMLESMRRLKESEDSVGEELEEHIKKIDAAFQNLQANRDGWDAKMAELIETHGLGEFDNADQQLFADQLADGLREQSAVYGFLHPDSTEVTD